MDGMRIEWASRTRAAVCRVTPVILIFLMVLLGLMPIGLPYVDPVTPALGIISVYYWSIHRPEYCPAAGVFIIGLLQDALSGTPMGMSSLVFLGVYGVGVSQRRVLIGKSVLVEWLGFLILGSVAITSQWAISALFFEFFIDPRPALTQCLFSAALYPCVAWVFGRARRSLMETV